LLRHRFRKLPAQSFNLRFNPDLLIMRIHLQTSFQVFPSLVIGSHCVKDSQPLR
jgi:hypothetical protein